MTILEQAVTPLSRKAARNARWTELLEGETLAGRVAQLPARGAYSGTRLFLRLDNGDLVSIPAAQKNGWTTLARALQRVRLGDRVTITFVGWRTSLDAARRYRDISVEVLGGEHQ